jgi:SagB-type dehydrogenase family enzyme
MSEHEFADFPVAWTYHRNSSRWAHNAAGAAGDELPEPGKESPLLPYTRLPAPRPAATALAELMHARCSCRCFNGTEIALAAIATVLHASYGVTGTSRFGASEFLERPVPSGGGLYALELYLIANRVAGLSAGIHHYVPVHHGLEEVREVSVPRHLLRYLFMGQDAAASAQAIVVIGGDTARCLKKYGDRGYRYLLLEAGHVAQQLNLAALAVGLQTLNVGGFFDDELAALCRMTPVREVPLYAVAVGAADTADRTALRFPDEA